MSQPTNFRPSCFDATAVAPEPRNEAVSFRVTLPPFRDAEDRPGEALARARAVPLAVRSRYAPGLAWSLRQRLHNPDSRECGCPLGPAIRINVRIARWGVVVIVLVVLVAGCGGSARHSTAAPTTGQAVPTEPSPSPALKGDPAAGKRVFAAQPCGGCHTFAPAGAVGTVGPNLANLPRDAQRAKRGSLVQYTLESIKDPNAYVVPGFYSVMPVTFGKTLSAKQIQDLVAFLLKG